MKSEVSRLTLSDLDRIEEMDKQIYPSEFQETRETIETILREGEFNFGVYAGGVLAGYILCEQDLGRKVYLYDIAILPAWQHQGLSKLLLQAYFAAVLNKDHIVRVVCRDTSYPIFSDEKRMNSYGYTIAEDVFEPDGYFARCSIHEDSHAMILVPAKDKKDTSLS
ncbi:hypothetical protein AUK40_06280 [Candidatus Wirthbacteria bacterium CG2_30_54_11]|uniref:N-acetyltransferase domain-containing protein n=1 Tax=Candidatus Wirthbacteria bacterium CG2_30_54_11 TaxID=1817892 RepID=A0A1J5IDD8_9BACT|nr:MAG: hypothetical protein AUK40_06280 [Candidatus Wirthbacteria bacterium CG2_30_54_11]